MKLESLAALCTLVVAVHAHAVAPGDGIFGRHAQLAQKRQATSSPVAAAAASTGASSAPAATPAGAAASSPPATGATSSPLAAGATSPAAAPVPAPTGPNGVPALANITSGMATGSTYAVSHTYAPGASPSISSAPPLPSKFVFNAADWPAQDVIPPTNSPEVQEWLKELDGYDIPSFQPTADGTCVGDPVAATDAQNRGWWTCGGWTRSTDITVCPDKLTWGVSFDDGPGAYTQKLLSYLEQQAITATFFVVGSRCIERPEMLVEEYMSGHEISVHTWSHHTLTAMTNEQIVAELGWTRKIIKEVLGVTPTTMRPPFGDIDDRVRAISLAMGLQPIIWTRTPSGFSFDTFDWKVAAGTVTGSQQMDQFQGILGNATVIDTGFVVLQHDLFEITVDLAVGYTLPSARTHNPPFTLKRIGECNHIPLTNMYLETTTNKTFPYPANTTQKAGTGGGSGSGTGKDSTDAQGAAAKSGASRTLVLSAMSGVFAFVSGLLLL